MGERKPRGELAELSTSLQGLCIGGKRSEKDLRLAKKEAFKKVINYMTMGMDMSGLFPMMTSCANLSHDDVVLKKMLYLYITHYATQTPDLALLAINQLHKDCNDQDPTVRGLALRSLCSLRLANLLEYLTAPINSGLEDRHPYVRKSAVMGVLKAWHLNKEVVSHQGMLERVKKLLYQDPDVQVVANCIAVMTQVEGVESLAEKVLVYGLLNRMREFSDWSQVLVMEVVAHYTPSGEPEVYDVLNVLEDRLGATNSAIVMAAIKCFLHLTLNMFATHQQVLERIKDPLKTLISRDDPATAFAVLSHVLLIVQRAPIIFETEYTAFYCRTHDPTYIKKLKMEILSAIASSSNAYDIVGELTEYARDINRYMGREAVRAIGRIALLVPETHGIVERLLLFLESGSDHLVSETLIQMKDLLRRYPDLAEICISGIGEIEPSSIDDAEARAALVWILGQHGQHMQATPYTLERLVDSFASEAPPVRLALLTAVTQLFFKRPPEVQPLLGRALAAGVSDSHQDVHDRALLYYRLLRRNVADAERIASPPIVAVPSFSEAVSPELKERVFSEFNTLSVIYQTPASMFVDKQEESIALVEEGEGEQDGDEAVDTATNLLSNGADLDGGAGGLMDGDLLGDVDTPPSMSTPPSISASASASNLLDMDLLSLGTSTSAQAAPAGGAPLGPLLLNPQAKVAPAAFQQRWKTLSPAHQYGDVLSPATVSALSANDHRDFRQHMEQAYIMTMASGGQPPRFRYYFYAQTSDGGSLFLVEMVVATDSGQASITMKTDAPELLGQFVELWTMCLTVFYR